MPIDKQDLLNGENGKVTGVANAKSIGEVEGRVVLSDGRRLGYRATGAPDGDPLFYFHGFPDHGLRRICCARRREWVAGESLPSIGRECETVRFYARSHAARLAA